MAHQSNSTVILLSHVLFKKNVAASAAEPELGALFANAKEARVIRPILSELGHPQLPTPIRIDNMPAIRTVNIKIKRQRSRLTEMRYFWLLDQASQKYFKFYYQPGAKLLSDYPKKV